MITLIYKKCSMAGNLFIKVKLNIKETGLIIHANRFRQTLKKPLNLNSFFMSAKKFYSLVNL